MAFTGGFLPNQIFHIIMGVYLLSWIRATIRCLCEWLVWWIAKTVFRFRNSHSSDCLRALMNFIRHLWDRVVGMRYAWRNHGRSYQFYANWRLHHLTTCLDYLQTLSRYYLPRICIQFCNVYRIGYLVGSETNTNAAFQRPCCPTEHSSPLHEKKYQKNDNEKSHTPARGAKLFLPRGTIAPAPIISGGNF